MQYTEHFLWVEGGWDGRSTEWEASWEPVEIIQVKHDCGPYEGCGGWVELDLTSIQC